MSETKYSITYAGKSIPFHLCYSKRKSLGIVVHPDGSVFVKAPLGTDETLIAYRVYKRAYWINRQLLYFSQFNPRTPKRRFVGGESHLYLGKKYRLKIRHSETEAVLLKNGYFYISTVDNKPQHIEKLLKKWYRNKADIYFSQVLEKCWLYFQNKSLNKPALKIRTMKTRWGSLSLKGGMTLNLELIKAPRECIEYVVIHELCHLLHAHHGKVFYELLARLLPDWVNRKHKLEKIMS